MGTGPFKFAEWKKGSYVILDRNKDYFVKGIPYLDRLVFQEIPDAAARVLALESGDIDYLAYQALPSSSVPRLKTNPKLVASLDGFEALASIEILAFNMDNPQLKDVRVRQAIAYAINKQEIVDKADYGIGKAATGPISSLTTWAYEPNVNKYPYDPKRAAKLLDDAGFPIKPDGARMTLRLIADGGVELNRKACEILKEQLAQVGVKVDLQLVERNVMLDRVYVKRDYDMHVHGFSTGADPAIDVSRLYVSTNIRPVSFTNGAGYRNPKVDELFMQGQKAFKPEDRAKAYREVQKVLTDEVPAIWLVEYGIVGVWSKKLHGLAHVERVLVLPVLGHVVRQRQGAVAACRGLCGEGAAGDSPQRRADDAGFVGAAARAATVTLSPSLARGATAVGGFDPPRDCIGVFHLPRSQRDRRGAAQRVRVVGADRQRTCRTRLPLRADARASRSDVRRCAKAAPRSATTPRLWWPRRPRR